MTGVTIVPLTLAEARAFVATHRSLPSCRCYGLPEGHHLHAPVRARHVTQGMAEVPPPVDEEPWEPESERTTRWGWAPLVILAVVVLAAIAWRIAR